MHIQIYVQIYVTICMVVRHWNGQNPIQTNNYVYLPNEFAEESFIGFPIVVVDDFNCDALFSLARFENQDATDRLVVLFLCRCAVDGFVPMFEQYYTVACPLCFQPLMFPECPLCFDDFSKFGNIRGILALRWPFMFPKCPLCFQDFGKISRALLETLGARHCI